MLGAGQRGGAGAEGVGGGEHVRGACARALAGTPSSSPIPHGSALWLLPHPGCSPTPVCPAAARTVGYARLDCDPPARGQQEELLAPLSLEPGVTR